MKLTMLVISSQGMDNCYFISHDLFLKQTGQQRVLSVGHQLVLRGC